MIRSLTKTLENYQTDYSLLKDKFEKVQTEFKRQTTKEMLNIDNEESFTLSDDGREEKEEKKK